MCRALLYLGEPVLLDNLLFKPDSALVRQTFNRQSPVTRYTTVPASFVLIQRINLGLFALLGRLRATADWRRITEEIWPWVDAAPATPLGRADSGGQT